MLVLEREPRRRLAEQARATRSQVRLGRATKSSYRTTIVRSTPALRATACAPRLVTSQLRPLVNAPCRGISSLRPSPGERIVRRHE